MTVESDVKTDDLLVSSGLDGIFPAGYPVARVSKVERNPADTFALVEAKPLAQHMHGSEFLLASLCAALPVIGVWALGLMSWQRIVVGVLLAALAAGWLARRFQQRLGGYTGDCLGAVQQMSETAFYLGALATLPGWWTA